MPYRNIRELPSAVKEALPVEAQRQFLRVVNSQLERGLEEGRAFASAWSVIEENWHKNTEGKWVKKSTDAMRFLTKNAPARYTLGIVYAPNTLDTDDEFASSDVIEKACWGFMRKLQGQSVSVKQASVLLTALCKAAETPDGIRVDVTELLDIVQKGRLGDQHTSWDDDESQVVECYLAPADMQIGEERITKGTWLLGVVWSEDAFSKIASGERTGLSMGGFGKTIEAEVEEAAHAA